MAYQKGMPIFGAMKAAIGSVPRRGWWKAALCILPFALAPAPCMGNSTPEEEEGDYIMEHIADSHVWHFFTINGHHVQLPLPVIVYKEGAGFSCFSSGHLQDAHHQPQAYQGFLLLEGRIVAEDGATVWDFSFTKVAANLLLCLLLMLLLFIGLARRTRQVEAGEATYGWWVLPLECVLLIRNMAKEQVGDRYREFLPFLLSLFSFIWVSNTFGLLPGAANITGNITIPLGFALSVFVVTLANASKDFWHHLFRPEGAPLWLLPILVPIELVGLITKHVTLTIRLFANVLAGHLALLGIISVIFILKHIFASVLIIPLGVFIILLKLGISFFQAYLFTMLAATSIGQSVTTHPHHT